MLGQTELKPPNYTKLTGPGSAIALFSGGLTFGPGFHPVPRHTQPIEDPIFDSCHSKWSLVQWLPLNSTTLPFYFGTLTGLGITYLVDETKLVPILWLKHNQKQSGATSTSIRVYPQRAHDNRHEHNAQHILKQRVAHKFSAACNRTSCYRSNRLDWRRRFEPMKRARTPHANR